MLSKINEAFDHYKNRNAFCINGKYFSYSKFYSKVKNIYNILKEHNTNADQLVGIYLSDDIYTYASIIAIWYHGKGYVPIHPHNPVERNMAIIEHSGIDILLSSDNSIKQNYPSEFINVVDNTALCAGVNDSLNYKYSEHAVAYLLFTSGSTGTPKGVPISFGNVTSFVNAFFDLGIEVNCNDRVLQMFDLTFDLSVMSYLIPFIKGACIYTVPTDEMKYTAIFSLLEKYKITVALMVPSVLSFLRKFFSEITLPDMRYSLFCGEALYEDVVKEWAKCIPNARIFNVYGPTEATIFCLAYEINFNEIVRSDKGIVCIGKPMDKVSSVIADEDNCIISSGEIGELCLGGSQNTKGYWRDIEKTNNAFVNVNNEAVKYYLSGDLAFTDEDGYFYYCGRKDTQVKIQGYRVELAEVEFHARNVLGKNVVAVVNTASSGNKEIILFVENYQGTTHEILTLMRTKLPAYMMPASVVICPTFTLNTNGKTDRNNLLKNYLYEY